MKPAIIQGDSPAGAESAISDPARKAMPVTPITLQAAKNQWDEVAIVMTENAQTVWSTELENDDYKNSYDAALPDVGNGAYSRQRYLRRVDAPAYRILPGESILLRLPHCVRTNEIFRRAPRPRRY